ncbi:MAG TPA: OmpA family protein [Phycisphaerales bacterium]|nr:OmpA family protein [Phycisphaerales bacterium]
MADHEEKHGEGGRGGGHGGGHGAHGGGGHAEGEHEGAPEWLISFADNVALMMGFFVILLAMNMGPKGDPKQGGEPSETNAADGAPSAHQLDMILSIREGFGNPVSIDSNDPKEVALVRRLREKTGGMSHSDGPLGRHDRQQAVRPSDYDRVTASVTFDDRSALLSAEARETIAQVAQKQKDQRWIVEVRGHAGPYEVMRERSKALELSLERAKAVARALVDSGMPWEAVRVVGCADADRVVGRTFDREQDRGNQRVELVVTNYLMPSDPYAAPQRPDTKAAVPDGAASDKDAVGGGG